MGINQNSIKVDEKYSILLRLPKQCFCNVCVSTKENIKSELGEKKFYSVCKSLGVL